MVYRLIDGIFYEEYQAESAKIREYLRPDEVSRQLGGMFALPWKFGQIISSLGVAGSEGRRGESVEASGKNLLEVIKLNT